MTDLKSKLHGQSLVFCLLIGTQFLSLLACGSASTAKPGFQTSPTPTMGDSDGERAAKIPGEAVKISPENDLHPPLVLEKHANEYEQPVPVPGAINTAGVEDSPFITPDGESLYFFFTPDAGVPAEKQILDDVTGIYVSHKVNGRWSQPKRILLQDPGKIALDGCAFISGATLWFCSIREGFSEIHWFTAEYQNGRWQNWKLAEFNLDHKVGELHITSNGSELYFHADWPGGQGQRDIWVSKRVNGTWQTPTNVTAVNTPDSEGWPAISSDGNELWFTRNHGLWRSERVNGEWQTAEQIVSSLAGEPSIDSAGNLYFVHHFFVDDRMIESDLYVAYRK